MSSSLSRDAIKKNASSPAIIVQQGFIKFDFFSPFCHPVVTSCSTELMSWVFSSPYQLPVHMPFIRGKVPETNKCWLVGLMSKAHWLYVLELSHGRIVQQSLLNSTIIISVNTFQSKDFLRAVQFWHTFASNPFFFDPTTFSPSPKLVLGAWWTSGTSISKNEAC